MKKLIVLDIPDNIQLDTIEITLWQNSKKTILTGKVIDVPERKANISVITGDELQMMYEEGFNNCLDEILG